MNAKFMSLFFLCLLFANGIIKAEAKTSDNEESKTTSEKKVVFSSLALIDNPFVEARYKANFITGDKTSNADTFRIKSGTDGFLASVYGKKPEGEIFEFTSFRAGISPLKNIKLSVDFFYGSVSTNGLASRIKNAPSTSSSTAYSPVKPTHSRFFGQSTASDKNTIAGELFAGNWRAAIYADNTEDDPETIWFTAGWVGKPPAAQSSTMLSVMAFGGKGFFQEKESTSWFPSSTHRDTESQNIYAGGELALKTKQLSFSLFLAGADGTLRPDSGRLAADVAVYGKNGRVSLFYTRTDRDYLPLSGSKPTMLEKAGLSPYFTHTFRKKFWFRISAGGQIYIALKPGDKITYADSEYWFAGSFITLSMRNSSLTLREKATGEKIQFEAAFKNSSLFSKKLVISSTAKIAFPWTFQETETEKLTAEVKYRFTLYREAGIKGEMEKEEAEDDREYTATVFYADRVKIGRIKTDLSAQLSAHTDKRKFSGSVTAKVLID